MKLHTQAFLLLSLCAYSVLGAWHLTWSDEFNGARLNESEWIYEEGCDGWGNGELQCYTVGRTENARIEDGHLVIDARSEDWRAHAFTSARIRSRFAQAYGKFEARARMPSGHQLWPAIWMMPKDSTIYGSWAASGEIDIVEMKGDTPNTILGTLHYGGSWPNHAHSGSGDKVFPVDFSADFHTFAIEWTTKEMKWLVDDKVFHTENLDRSFFSGKGETPYTKNGQPFDQKFFWILNIAVGGQFFGPGPYINGGEAHLHWKKHTMDVDYLRVYEWKA